MTSESNFFFLYTQLHVFIYIITFNKFDGKNLKKEFKAPGKVVIKKIEKILF